MAPGRVAKVAMLAAGLPAGMTEFEEHFATGLLFEPEFLRGADPFRRSALDAFPQHKGRGCQLLDAHGEHGGMLEKSEPGGAACVQIHFDIGRPPCPDPVLSGDGSINLLHWCFNLDAVNQFNCHIDSNSTSRAGSKWEIRSPPLRGRG